MLLYRLFARATIHRLYGHPAFEVSRLMRQALNAGETGRGAHVFIPEDEWDERHSGTCMRWIWAPVPADERTS